MQRLMRCLLLTAALVATGAVGAQQASAPSGPPAGFTAPEPPKPDDTNAERARSQPFNNAPFWRGVRNSGEQAGFTSLPGPEKGVLIQRFVQYPGSPYTTAGEAWRDVRNRWIVPYGGALFLIALLAVAIYHFGKGPIGEPMRMEGRRIERFTPFERAAHWTNAIAFVILAVSGLVMAFGRVVLLPWMGLTLHGWLAYALKTIHNFVGPLFVVSLIVVILTFVRDELFREGDGAWMRNVGTVLNHGPEPPSHRFNAGEKVLFWISAVVLGLVAVGSGLFLDHLIPGFEFTRGQMQVAHMVHFSAAILMIAALVIHIYLGTAGVRGAYTGMRHGYVDEHWADEHHKLWADDVRAGRIPAQRSGRKGEPAERLRGRPV